MTLAQSLVPVAAALQRIRERIAIAAERAGRDPTTVRLIAVTKGVDASRIDEAIAAGARDIGENRVQEAYAKHAEVSGAATWHLIGHLQTNKAKRAAEIFDVVQSVDSERVARALSDHRSASNPIEALIEVELTGIAGRTGVRQEAVAELASAMAGMEGVRFAGLMTIAPPVADPADATPFLSRLRRMRDELADVLGLPLPELSMGMSHDFEAAVEQGATMVRVGSAIFGERR